AIVLSVLVLIGWQYFIAGPQIEKAQQEAALQAQNNPNAGAPTAATTPAPAGTPASAPATTLTRDRAIAAAPRVPIASDRLAGSINLVGGRIDDLRLTAFTEEIDPASPPVTLLSPGEGPDGYFVEFGWLPPTGSALALPGPQTRWTAPADAKLTTATPVTLTYDNGAGLVFTRTIAVDANYMFTVTDA